jgi:hypothetical protein
MSEQIKTVFISQYALTQGIFSVKARVCDDSMIEDLSPQLVSSYYHKPHWHHTKEEAKAQAERMRQRKVASLEKQIAKLKAMTF